MYQLYSISIVMYVYNYVYLVETSKSFLIVTKSKKMLSRIPAGYLINTSIKFKCA